MANNNNRKEPGNAKFTNLLRLELPCEYAGKVVIPSIRALVVKTLVQEYKMTKYKAAKIMGLTPAAVTYYLSGDRGKKLVDEIERNRELLRIVKEIADVIARNNGIHTLEDYARYRESICKICSKVNVYAQMAGCH